MITHRSIQNSLKGISENLQRIESKLDGSTPGLCDWYDSQDICRLLNISKRTLAHYRERGFIPYSRISGKVFYRLSDIEDSLNSHIVRKEARI